jgi:hypothetical protein
MFFFSELDFSEYYNEAYITSVCHLEHTCNLSHPDPIMLLSMANQPPLRSVSRNSLPDIGQDTIVIEGGGGRVSVNLPTG